jgi:hypothetical protein
MMNYRLPAAFLIVFCLTACEDPRDPVDPVVPVNPATALIPDTIVFPKLDDTTVVGGPAFTLSSLVLDSAGKPVSGVQVEWTFGVSTTQLTFSPEAPLTDENGIARTAVMVNDTVARVYTIYNFVRIPSGAVQSHMRLRAIPAALDRVELTADTVPFTLGTAKQFAAVAFDRYGNRITTIPMQWASADPTVASVDGAGWVTALRPGSTTVSVSAGNQQKTADIAVLAPATFRALVSSDDGLTRCGIADDARAFCWGQKWLNTGVTAAPDTCSRPDLYRGATGPCYQRPRELAGNHRWSKLELGGSHSCGITTEGRGYCWGENRYGQLGSGSPSVADTTTLPRAIDLSARLSDITTSMNYWEYSCALTEAGAAYCWGTGNLGRDPARPNAAEPVPVTTDLRFKDITAGSQVCAIALDGRAYCWTAPHVSGVAGVTPQLVSETLRFTSISSETVWVCGLTVERVGYCWFPGSTNVNQTIPTAVMNGAPLRSIQVSGGYECAVPESGEALCAYPSSSAYNIQTSLPVNTLLVGTRLGTSYCFLTLTNEAYCAGSNFVGRLGNGTDYGSQLPVGVMPPR